MKIVHIITGLNDGGAEGVLFRLCKYDLEQEHFVISMTDEGKYAPMLRNVGIDVYCLNMINNRAYFKLAHLEAFLRKNHFTEYKRNKLSRRLQDMGADDTAIKINNKSVRVWRLPIDGINDQQIVSPSFGGGEAPF